MPRVNPDVHIENDFLRYSLPYHFQKLPSDRFQHVYLPVNRRCLPLGTADGDVNFRDYLHLAFVFDRDPHQFEGIWYDAVGLYLYSDKPESKRGYGERLDRLLAMRMRIVEGIR